MLKTIALFLIGLAAYIGLETGIIHPKTDLVTLLIMVSLITLSIFLIFSEESK